jgi:hypothetical protein
MRALYPGERKTAIALFVSMSITVFCMGMGLFGYDRETVFLTLVYLLMLNWGIYLFVIFVIEIREARLCGIP